MLDGDRRSTSRLMPQAASAPPPINHPNRCAVSAREPRPSFLLLLASLLIVTPSFLAFAVVRCVNQEPSFVKEKLFVGF
jgi:hypothetical protein